MTKDEHRSRHQELHSALDELLADWIAHLPRTRTASFRTLTVMKLMEWSYNQTLQPSLRPGETHDEPDPAEVFCR